MKKWKKGSLILPDSHSFFAASLFWLPLFHFCLNTWLKGVPPGLWPTSLSSRSRRTAKPEDPSMAQLAVGSWRCWDFVENKQHQRTRASRHHLQVICQLKFNYFRKPQGPGAPGFPCWWAQRPPNHIFCDLISFTVWEVLQTSCPRSDPWIVRWCLDILWGACHFQWLWWMRCLSLSQRSRSGDLCWSYWTYWSRSNTVENQHRSKTSNQKMYSTPPPPTQHRSLVFQVKSKIPEKLFHPNPFNYV